MFPVIIRQSSVGVSMCPMLAWEREDRGLERQAGKACGSLFIRILPASADGARALRPWTRV